MAERFQFQVDQHVALQFEQLAAVVCTGFAVLLKLHEIVTDQPITNRERDIDRFVRPITQRPIHVRIERAVDDATIVEGG